MTKTLMTACLGLSLFTSTAAMADENEAETCLRAMVWEEYADGWAIRTMTTTTLKNAATRNYLVTFYKGNEYQIRTCADGAMKNLDVVLYDLDGNVVLRDDSDGKQPLLTYKPEQTTTYYIVVHARELVNKDKDAGVAVAVTYR